MFSPCPDHLFSADGMVSGAIPSPDTAVFLTWRQNRFNTFVSRAQNATVDVTYYFSNSGNNNNDGLTSSTPKQTLAAANALLVDGSRTQILFDRGSKFLGGISAPNTGTFKFGAYGTGAKPRFTTFNSSGYLDADNAWTLSAGNMYVKTVTPTKRIGWIREVAAPYNPYMYLTTTALVQLMPYSWTQTLTTATYTADNTTDFLTSAGHGLNNDDIVELTNSGGAVPTGLYLRKNYFVVNKTVNTFQLALTAGGAAINFTSNGTGTNSWNKMSGLYINMGGTDPNTVDLEVTPDFNDMTEGWSQSEGDGTGNIYYVEDLVFDGHGAVPGQDNSVAVYGIHAGVTGSDLFVANRCETYYNGRHGIGHTNSNTTGGKFYLKDCAAAYCSVDATSFVSFSGTTSGASGFESMYQGCYNPYGKLPSNDYDSPSGGSVYPGGPSTSGVYAHTGGSTLAMFAVWQHDFQDNRGTYSRATYEMGDMTAGNAPGTYNDLRSIRCWFNAMPISRLNTIASATVTADSTTDIISQASNPYVNGDVVMLSSTGTMPGNVTARKPYFVMNRSAGGYQLGSDSIYVSSVNAGTDTITGVTSYTWSNGDRVFIRAEAGQLPGGLDSTTQYYIVGLSGADLQLSLTSGGAAVDITDAGIGLFRLYGGIVNMSSNGTGTISSEGAAATSGFVQTNYSSPAVYINNAYLGFQASGNGVGANATTFNEIKYIINAGYVQGKTAASSILAYNAHYKLRTRGFFWYINLSSNANAALFNCIIDNQGFVSAVNVTNDTSHVRGTALYDPGSVVATLISADDYKVTLTSSPVIGAAPLSTFDTEGFPGPGIPILKYDYFFNGRNTVTPSIGPIKA